MQKFFTSIIISVLTDPKVQATIEALLGKLITERILPLIPLAVGAATKAAVDEVIKVVPGVKDLIQAGVNIEHTTEAARQELNKLIPDVDLGIPALDNLLDFWRPKASS